MDIGARASSLADRPQAGHQGHQCSHAPGRPNLHLISSSRRPRQVSASTNCVWFRPFAACWPRRLGLEQARSRQSARACWQARWPAHCGAAVSSQLRPGYATTSDVTQSRRDLSSPTMWNEFFPMSMPTTAIALCNVVVDMACSSSGCLRPAYRWPGRSTAGPSHYRTLAP